MGTNKEKYKIFEDLCKKLLSHLTDEYPKIDSNSKNKTLIVENRWDETVEYAIRNTIQKMGDGWGHIIFCGNNNIEEVSKLRDEISSEIEIINLGDKVITRNSYNSLLYELEFWNKVNCEKVLVYQSDTFIFKDFDESFLEWDYIGAPWGPSRHSDLIKIQNNFSNELYVGNGGFSLRSVEAIKWCLKTKKAPPNFMDPNLTHMFEDIFFSHQIEMSEQYKLAPLSIANKFSFEHIYREDTFACHQPFVDSFMGHNLLGKFVEKINGVNVLGFGNFVLGLGHNMRQIVKALEIAKIPHCINELPCGATRIEHFKNDESNYFDTNLILCNPDIQFLKSVGHNYIRGKKNIVLWAWELETLPESWVKESNLFDEIWTISDFCKKAFEKHLPNKKIEVINIPGNFKNLQDKKESKLALSLENKFVVTFIFDGNSDRMRKNPDGVIKAFNKYLVDFDNTILFIKTHNLKDSDLELLKSLDKSSRLILVNESWSNEKMTQLISATDMYVSLHRSEGSGLTIMESIYLGIPTITTNWSGNLDFCESEFCELIDYGFTDLTTESFYWNENKEAKWAEPNIEQAALKMLDIYNNYNFYKMKAQKGKDYIDEKFNLEKLANFLQKKFNKI
jgi:glycosyltransferase involved in cell wall biosynthesis